MTGPNGHPIEVNGLAHLSDAELAGYLDHDLSDTERRRVETHIDECAACRREIVALLPITHPGESADSRIVHRPRRWWVPAAAAAVIAAMAVPRLTRNAPGPDVPQRARPVPEAGSRSRLAIVAPADDATVAGPLVFTWRSTNADTYRIVLLTDDGAPVWTKDTGDTIATLPDSVTLEADRAYFWQVEAIGNGINVATGFHRLQTPRK